MTNILEGLEITKVALCGMGMNQEAEILLFKSADERGTTDDVLKANPQGINQYTRGGGGKGKRPPQLPKRRVTPGAGKGKDDTKRVGLRGKRPDRFYRGPEKSFSKGVEAMTDIKKEDLPAEVIEYVESLEDELAALGEMTNDELAALRGMELVKEAPKDEIDKSALPENVRKALEAAEQTERRLAKMEADTRRADFVRKAETDFGKLAPAADLGPVLEAIDRVLPEEAKVLDRMLKAIAAQADTSELFKELGTSFTGSQSETDALIAANVEKGMSRQDAIKKTFDEHPELYPETPSV